jgi:hypothetical protein
MLLYPGMQGKEAATDSSAAIPHIWRPVRQGVHTAACSRLARSPVIPLSGELLIWAYMSILSHTVRWRVEGMEHARKLWTGPEDGFGLLAFGIPLMPVMQITFRRKW